MADICKCDKCGRIFKPDQGNSFTVKKKGLKYVYPKQEQQENWRLKVNYDFCRSCFKGLRAFLEEGEQI